MKRDEQIWWFIIFFTLVVIFDIALFSFTKDYWENENRLSTASLIITSDLLANHNFKDLPYQDDDQSPEEPQQVYLLQAASVNNADYSLTVRQVIPFWERAFKMERPRIILNSLLPIFVILLFSFFYRTARTNPRDNYPDH